MSPSDNRYPSSLSYLSLNNDGHTSLSEIQTWSAGLFNSVVIVEVPAVIQPVPSVFEYDREELVELFVAERILEDDSIKNVVVVADHSSACYSKSLMINVPVVVVKQTVRFSGPRSHI